MGKKWDSSIDIGENKYPSLKFDFFLDRIGNEMSKDFGIFAYGERWVCLQNIQYRVVLEKINRSFPICL